MPPNPKPPLYQTLLAFAAIYLIWGSTFLAIRIGVLAIPPLLYAALRFTVAGLILFTYVLIKRHPFPSRKQLGSVTLLATLIFLINYGLLFWAERRVPSGVASVLIATVPAFTAVAEILILRTRRFTLPLVLALLIGLAGVATLMLPTHGSSQPVDTLGACALIVSTLFWSTASSLSRKLPLPESKLMSAATQMLIGGLLLGLVAALTGQFQDFHPAQVPRAAWYALLYLIFAGSLLAFSAYVWLISHQSPTRVGTYAYVNPIVAVAIGVFLAHEPLGPRTIAGAALILLAVLVLTLTPTTSKTPKQSSSSF